MIFKRVCRRGKTFFSDLDTCPDNSREILACDSGFTPKIPVIWQCQDSMLSQKVEFEIIWREL